MKQLHKIAIVYIIANLLLALLLFINTTTYIIGLIILNTLLTSTLLTSLKFAHDYEEKTKAFHEEFKDKKIIYLNKEEQKILERTGMIVKNDETIFKNEIRDWVH